MKKLLFFYLIKIVVFTHKHDGGCKEKNAKFYRDCKAACPQNYDPVCALNQKDHKTFSNECELNQFNCLNREDGEHFFYFQNVLYIKISSSL